MYYKGQYSLENSAANVLGVKGKLKFVEECKVFF
jgi:hypothetical protein